MEKDRKQILRGKLNLDLPLLSTRRPYGISKLMLPESTTTSNNMVPFSWERIPGEPKDKEPNYIQEPRTPKPPPGRWQPPVECLSDANDIFSLAESIVNDDDDDGGLDTSCRGEAAHDDLSPSFIIQRFLPDAQALAEASVANKNLPLSGSNASFSRAVSIRRSYGSPKGCGLGSFLPWRMKPKPCSVKSPVCDTIIGFGPNQKQQNR